MPDMYQVIRSWRSDFLPIRSVNYHVQVWGEPAPGRTPIVMLHGWMDVAASFQFVVDALQPDTYIIAPDWRGFGQSRVAQADTFWFPDYLADLDFLLLHYAPLDESGQVGQPAQFDLVGHSMGGNVSMLYAGIRPERVRRLVNLEGFGMPATRPEQAPGRYAQWLEQLQQLHNGAMDMRSHDSVDSVARRLMKTNPRLNADRALWLASHWAREETPGEWRIQGHPAHRISNAQLYRLDETLEVHKCITAPTLAVEASHNSLEQWWNSRYSLDEYHQRLKVVRNLEIACIDNAGHMLHHDQPEQLARLLERFLA